jgi:hypothetical protein
MLIAVIWRLILSFLTLGAEAEGEGEGEGAPAGTEGEGAGEEEGTGEGEQAAEGTGDDTLDDLIDHVEEDAGGKTPKENAAIREARRRAQEAEANLERERQARIAAESRASQVTPPQTDDDRLFQAEEARLKATDITELERWQIQSNRTIRANARTSSQALFAANDSSDRAAFERLEITKPKVYKRYAERVEKAVNEMRAKGQNAPRLAVLRLLIGDDIMNGKIGAKSSKAKAADTDAGSASSSVSRGKTPGARSDVSSKQRLTEHQKRIARLENQRI